MRQCSTEVIQDAADIDSRGNSSNKKCRVNRRLEERQFTHHSFDVHTMPDLKQTVGDCIPVAKQIIVLGDAEVECWRQIHCAFIFSAGKWES